MWEHEFQGISVFWFVSFLVTKIPNMLLNFPFEDPSSSCCLCKEFFCQNRPDCLNVPVALVEKMVGKRNKNNGEKTRPQRAAVECLGIKPGLFSEQFN